MMLEGLQKSPYISRDVRTYTLQDLVYVDMYQAAVVSRDAKTPLVLFTSAIVTCCGLAVHNPQSGVTGLTHLVADSDREDRLSETSEKGLRKLLRAVAGEANQPIEIRIVGPHLGGRMMQPFLDDILAVLGEFNAKILSADIDGKGPSCFGVDAQNWHLGLVRGKPDACDYNLMPDGEFSAQIKETHLVFDSVELSKLKQYRGKDGLLDLRSDGAGLEPWPNLTP